MPAWRNAKFWLAAVVFLYAMAAYADFKVTEIQPRLSAEILVLNGNLELSLTQKTEEALSKGIELSMLIEVRLYRQRALWWDQRVTSWTLRRNLQYHALSGQYLVTSGTTIDSFLSLGEALKFLGNLVDVRLALTDAADAVPLEDEYNVQVRAHLDIEALPPPLRPVAYTTLSWHLNSGWTAWNVTR